MRCPGKIEGKNMTHDISSFAILREYLSADLAANEGKRRSCAYRYLKWFRFSRFCFVRKKKILGALARIIKNHYGDRYGFDFLYTVPMGKGYTISHNSGVIFMAKEAGDNLIFRNFVVVGESFAGSGCPVIGNNITFGTGCKVLGPITIGDHVVIGANAVVTHDVPDHSVVAGVPAKVIRKTKDRWGTPYEV